MYRFQDCGRLEEITMQAEVVNIGKVAVPFANLAAFIHAHDPEAFERAGFVIPDSSAWPSTLRGLHG